MNEAMRTGNPWRTTAMVLLAVLVLLVVALASMLRPAETTGMGGRAVPPSAHATSVARPGSTEAPYVDHHAEVVASYQGNPR